MSSKEVVNLSSAQPVKKHRARHVAYAVIATLIAIVAWLAISSMMHRAV